MLGIMKNIHALLMLLLAVGILGCHRSTPISTSTAQLPNPSPCPDGIMIVENQPAAPGQLSIIKGTCEGHHWSVELSLKNVGTKTIASCELFMTEDYENKKGVSSSQDQGSFVIEPGASQVLQTGAGFTNGLSYGKPVGALKHNVFRITRISFSDGTTWGQRWTGP